MSTISKLDTGIQSQQIVRTTLFANARTLVSTDGMVRRLRIYYIISADAERVELVTVLGCAQNSNKLMKLMKVKVDGKDVSSNIVRQLHSNYFIIMCLQITVAIIGFIMNDSEIIVLD
jgi:hypothetical protein